MFVLLLGVFIFLSSRLERVIFIFRIEGYEISVKRLGKVERWNA